MLAAEQLLAGLSFVHFENTFKTDHRGVVVSPPPDWRPSDVFMDTLLSGLTQNPALTPVTLSQFSTEVPVGGNGEPSTLRLQAGPAGHGITRTAALRIATARQQLTSWCCGSTSAVDGHTPGLTALADELLGTEASGLGPARRSAALTAYDRAFADQTGTITLATERTVTFTAQRAAIPVTVLSGSPYPVTVIVTLTSDKFTFPDGNSRQLRAGPPDHLGAGDGPGPDLGRPPPHRRHPAHPRRPTDHRPRRAHGAVDGDLLRRGGPHRPGRGRPVGVVGAHVGAGAGSSAGTLTVAPPRRARTLPLRTSAAYVAVGTSVSRLTGLLRFVAVAWALGQTFLADSYNLANVTPNMLYDVVLGGVLSATFIPVFVDRLAHKDEREAFESISAVVTVSVVVLLVTTVAALVAAPYLIDALTALDTHAPAAHVQRVVLERQVATTFLRWFVIQIAAYGVFVLGAALLDTRRRFVAVAWAPIINNLVCIGVLVWFGLWAGHGASLASVELHKSTARPPRTRHLARRAAPRGGPPAQPAPGRPPTVALELEPA